MRDRAEATLLLSDLPLAADPMEDAELFAFFLAGSDGFSTDRFGTLVLSSGILADDLPESSDDDLIFCSREGPRLILVDRLDCDFGEADDPFFSLGLNTAELLVLSFAIPADSLRLGSDEVLGLCWWQATPRLILFDERLECDFGEMLESDCSLTFDPEVLVEDGIDERAMHRFSFSSRSLSFLP